TATDIGVPLGPGDGLGLTTSLGAMRRFTMDAGLTLAIAGAGARDHIMRGPIGARRSSDSTAEAALDLASVSAEALVGSRFDSANRSARGTATASSMRATSIST